MTFKDWLDRSIIPLSLGFGLQTLTATDKNGRMWRVFREDTDAGTGTDTTWQFPVFTTPTGLAPGTGPTPVDERWNVRAESVLFTSLTFSTADIVLEETRREEVTYARAAAKDFNVN